MEEEELTTLLRSHDLKLSRRTWRCPDENQLAVYANGQSPARQKLEEHLADCKACLDTISLLVNQFDENETVPPAVLARVRRLAENRRTFEWTWTWKVAAASACLLIVAPIVLWQLWSVQTSRPSSDLVAQSNEPPLPSKPVLNTNSSPSVTAPHVEKPKVRESQTPVVRGDEANHKVTLVFPREGSIARLPVQPLRWLPVADAAFYEVKIVSEDGAAVATQSTNNTEILLPSDLLKPGSKYFVTVVAHLSGNRTIRSELVKFRIAEKR